MTNNQQTILKALQRLKSLTFIESQIKDNNVMASFTRIKTGLNIEVVINEKGYFSLDPHLSIEQLHE